MHGLTGGGWKRSNLTTVTAVKRPAGETRGKLAAGPDVRQRHRASPRPYRGLEVRLLIVLLPGFGCGVCLAGGGGRVTQPGGARVRTGSDRAGLCLLSCQ